MTVTTTTTKLAFTDAQIDVLVNAMESVHECCIPDSEIETFEVYLRLLKARQRLEV